MSFPAQPLPDMPLEKLNEFLLDYLEKDFMTDFVSDAQRAVIYSAGQCRARIHTAVQELEAARPVYAAEKLDKSKCMDNLEEAGRDGQGNH